MSVYIPLTLLDYAETAARHLAAETTASADPLGPFQFVPPVARAAFQPKVILGGVGVMVALVDNRFASCQASRLSTRLKSAPDLKRILMGQVSSRRGAD